MWLLVGLSGFWLVQALRAGQADPAGLARGLVMAGISLLLAGWLGVRAARHRAREHAAAGRTAARMLLLAQLGQQDDAALERIAASRGPAADAAVMILRGRHLGNPAGSPKRSSPES
jgi:hypothetical protein